MGIARGMDPTVEVAILIVLNWVMNWERFWLWRGIFDIGDGLRFVIGFRR